MTDTICPLCGKPNPPDRDECLYCQAPLKTGGFIAPAEGPSEEATTSPTSEQAGKPEDKAVELQSTSSLEQAVPDWLRETEAGFLGASEPKPEEPDSTQLSEQLDSLLNPPPPAPEARENAIDDDWLASLLVEAGAVEGTSLEQPQGEVESEQPELSSEIPGEEIQEGQEEEQAILTPPAEKPDWLTNLEASSKIKLEGGIFSGEPGPELAVPPEEPEEPVSTPVTQPDWLTKADLSEPEETPEIPATPEISDEEEPPIAPAELPGWLEALRPSDTVSPTGPVEDVSGADLVTSGPLTGLRGVISAHPSAIRAQKPPTYSIKLKVTEEQQARVQMMEELLADEDKPKPLPSKPIITSRYIFRLVVAIVLLLPIIWMIIANSRQSSIPLPESTPGVIDFAQRIQALPANAPVLIAFDYEAGFSGELNIAISNVLTQLINKNAYLTMVATTPSGPALAETMIKSASTNIGGAAGIYSNYADLGYIPGGTLGLMGLAASPKSILPYALDGKNVWAAIPLNAISAVKDFSAVIVITNDPDTARIWIEQVGTHLKGASTPLLFVTSAQAEPLIRPYYQASPAQVQGLIGGLAGGVAYANTVGNSPQSGVWDAFSAGVTISILIILIGSIAGVVVKMLGVNKKEN